MAHKRLRFRPSIQSLEERACLTAGVAVFTFDSVDVTNAMSDVAEVANRTESGNSSTASGITFDGRNVTLDISSVPADGDTDSGERSNNDSVWMDIGAPVRSNASADSPVLPGNHDIVHLS